VNTHPATALTTPEIKALVEEGYTSCMLDSSKQAWLKALRSGEFAQTKNTMVRKTCGIMAHCCLGVAATLLPDYRAEPLTGMVRQTGSLQVFDGTTALGNTLGVHENSPFAIYALSLIGPNDVPYAASHTFQTNNPRLGRWRASEWNDSHNKTFLEIADLIEKHTWGLPAPEETDNGN
jgi:hypothetical protein